MIIKYLHPLLYKYLTNYLVQDVIVLINDYFIRDYLKELPILLPPHNPYHYIYNHNHRFCRDHKRLFLCECNFYKQIIYRHLVKEKLFGIA